IRKPGRAPGTTPSWTATACDGPWPGPRLTFACPPWTPRRPGLSLPLSSGKIGTRPQRSACARRRGAATHALEERVKERFADIVTSAGTMRTLVVHPEQDGPFPAVILYMDFWGVREELFDIARWVATVGYCCLVPDLYYRQGSVHNE